jgi:hypothetical protein
MEAAVDTFSNPTGALPVFLYGVKGDSDGLDQLIKMRLLPYS